MSNVRGHRVINIQKNYVTCRTSSVAETNNNVSYNKHNNHNLAGADGFIRVRQLDAARDEGVLCRRSGSCVGRQERYILRDSVASGQVGVLSGARQKREGSATKKNHQTEHSVVSIAHGSDIFCA